MEVGLWEPWLVVLRILRELGFDFAEVVAMAV